MNDVTPLRTDRQNDRIADNYARKHTDGQTDGRTERETADLSGKYVISKHSDGRAVANEVSNRLHDVPAILPPREPGEKAKL